MNFPVPPENVHRLITALRDLRTAISRTGRTVANLDVRGIQARWRADGNELFYIAPDGKLMAASIKVNGAAIEPGAPMALFQTRIWGGGTNATQGPQYDVASDGRFLVNVATEDASAAPITLLLNWKRSLDPRDLPRRVPGWMRPASARLSLVIWKRSMFTRPKRICPACWSGSKRARRSSWPATARRSRNSFPSGAFRVGLVA